MSSLAEMADLQEAGHSPSREYEDLTQRAGSSVGLRASPVRSSDRPRTAPVSSARARLLTNRRAVALNVHRNGVHGRPTKVLASNLSDALDKSGTALDLPFAARRMFINTGAEISSDDELWSLENGATVYVTHLAGENFLDPFSASLRAERSMTRKVAWSAEGVQFDKDTRANTTQTKVSPRIERLAGGTHRRVLTFRNGTTMDGQIVVCFGHKSQSTSSSVPPGHLQFLEVATAKLALASSARRAYGLDLTEIKDMTEAPMPPPDLRCVLGAMSGPVWIVKGGEKVSAEGQLSFIERTLADAKMLYAALSADMPVPPVRHSTWFSLGVTGTTSNEERAVEMKLAVDYLHRMQSVVREKKEELELAQEDALNSTAQTDDADDFERSARIGRLQASDGVLKFSVVENGKEDIEQNRVTVLINAGKEVARGASAKELLQKLIDLATAQVQPSRGHGRKLLWRKPIDNGLFDVRKVTSVSQWYDRSWMEQQGLFEIPTFFLSCGEPFMEWENNMVTLELSGADALATDAGKVQVLHRGIDELDARSTIASLRKGTKNGKDRALVFSSLLEVPEPLFRQVGADEIESEPLSVDDATVCLLPKGGMEQPHGRAFYRPTLARDATTDHCHTAGQQLKSIHKWEQWVIDRTGAIDEQGQSVSDRAAFIRSKLLPDLVLTEAENPHGLGFEVIVAKRETRNPRQLWTFQTDGTISPLSSPTKYLTFHQTGEGSGSMAAAYAAYVNLAAQVNVNEIAVNSTAENALHITAHAAAPVGSNAHPADCDTHVLAMIHTSDSMAKVISAVRNSVVTLTEQCHEKGISDVQLATFDNDFHQCGLGIDDDWRGNIRRRIRVGSGTDYMLPCEFLFRYLRESKETFNKDKCHRVHVVFLADGRAKRHPNQSWLDDCSGLIGDLEKQHILVTIHVVCVAQGSQFNFLYPLSEICRDRGTMDYITEASDSTETADEQVKSCFGVLLRRWLSMQGVPFIPLIIHLADGTANGFECAITADSEEPAGDRNLAKWRHKVLFSGSIVVRLPSRTAVEHVRDNVQQSLLAHQDGRQPNSSVSWTYHTPNVSVEATQASLSLLKTLERDWIRGVLKADDTFQHPLGESLPKILKELRACGEVISGLQAASLGTPFSTAGRVSPNHSGSNQVTSDDLTAMNMERERHERAVEQMNALMSMHSIEDQALEAIGNISRFVTGAVPAMQLRDRKAHPFFFDTAKRYRILMGGEQRHFGLKGSTARLLDIGEGVEVPWQFSPVIGKENRYTIRTCWREANHDRRSGFSLGVSNGNVQLFAATDNKNLAEWDVVLEDSTPSTFTLRYRAAIPGKGSDGMHIGFSSEGNGKLLPQSKPVIPWIIECIDEQLGSAALTFEERLNQLDIALGSEEFAWDADQDAQVMRELAQLGEETTFAKFQDIIDSVYYHRPTAELNLFEDAFRGNQTGGIDTRALCETFQQYRVAQMLMNSVTVSNGVYESILDELPYTFTYSADGVITDDEFSNGIDDLMIDLPASALEFVKQYMSHGSSGLNFARFEEAWGFADKIARFRLEREAVAGDEGSSGAGSHNAIPEVDIVLSTQPKARRDRPARNQQWGLHQPGFQTVGQWRLCRNESLEWQKQALVWPTPPHLKGSFNEALHWPLRGVLVAHAPWDNENESLKRMLPRTTAKVPSALFVRVVPNGEYEGEDAYQNSVSVQVPLAMIEGGADESDVKTKNRTASKKGLGQLPVPTQEWLSRTLGATNAGADQDDHQNDVDPRLDLLLQACTRALGYTVPARKIYMEDGKLVRSVSTLCERERQLGGEKQQLLFVSRGELFCEGPPQPGQCAAPTEALRVAPTFGAIIYRMGEDDTSEDAGHKVTARPEKRANALENDEVALRSYLDEVGQRLSLPNYVRSLHFHDGTELKSLKVEYKPGGVERVWPHLWVSCGEPFVPPEEVPVNIYRREQREISGALKQLKEEMKNASADELKALQKEYALKKKALKSSEVAPAAGTTANLSSKWNRMAKPSITVKTVLARWMGEREAVAPVRCRGRDMEELLISCNDRLTKQASRPRRMFKKNGEEITAHFDKIIAGKMTEEVWVSMGEPFMTRAQMFDKQQQKAKVASAVRDTRPAKTKK